MIRTTILLGVLLLAACGKKAAPTCDPVALDALRARFDKAPMAAGDPGGLPPRVLADDGADRVPGAAILRFTRAADVMVQVGDHPARIAGELGSTDAVLAELTAALAAAPAKVVEVESFGDLAIVALTAILVRLDPATDVHLIVDRQTPPPRDGVAPWAQETYDGVLKLPGDQRATEFSRAASRALGKTCGAVIDPKAGALAQLRPGPGKERALRRILPDALAECGCAGADVATAAWLFELLISPGYRPAWLRLHLDTGGRHLVDMHTVQEVAGALETMTADERTRGAWITPAEAAGE